RNYHIKGRYHPVQPIVVHKHPVFKQNTREYCMLETENFGTVTQIEVGACMVGKIKNHHEAGVIHRGCEKGMFLFGGSTIVLLFKNGVLDIPDDLFAATAQGKEAVVRYGEAIARKAE
ncbi:MAG: phosphatidylserine decarboxylase, partial [Firmicutes bacterium]|nr:phosphatidylserine decarboxylase [Bacillota bacterium]